MRLVPNSAVALLGVTLSLGTSQAQQPRDIPVSSGNLRDSTGHAAKVASKAAARHKSKAKNEKPYQVGVASWYGRAFQGKKTASGERYNMFHLTAAHPVLPLGTMVKVTDLRNGAWVVVRINDRGPVFKSRIIDLSYEAAQALGLSRHGVDRVRLDLLPSLARLQVPQF